jgi:hypothetical protein
MNWMRGIQMKSLDCKLERVSNTMIGAVLFFIGLVFVLLGLTIIPVIGLLIALPVIIMGTIFIFAPRSKACTLVLGKVREVASRK